MDIVDIASKNEKMCCMFPIKSFNEKLCCCPIQYGVFIIDGIILAISAAYVTFAIITKGLLPKNFIDFIELDKIFAYVGLSLFILAVFLNASALSKKRINSARTGSIMIFFGIVFAVLVILEKFNQIRKNFNKGNRCIGPFNFFLTPDAILIAVLIVFWIGLIIFLIFVIRVNFIYYLYIILF